MSRERRKARGLAVMILFMLLIELTVVSFSASAGLITTVSVDMEDSVEVEVSPGSDGKVAFKGVVTCQNVNPTPCIVSLSATSSVGSATIDKPSILFQGGGTQTEEIEVEVQVPLLTNVSESESCMVTGYWQQGGTTGSVESDTTQVIILPFYKLTIFSENPVEEVESGKSKDFGMRMENTGNCEDTNTLTITNLEELKDKGVTVDCISQVSLESHNHYKFKINAKTSSETPTQGHRILLRLTSQGPETDPNGPYEEEFQLIIRVVTFKIGCGTIQALQYIGIAAAVIVTGVFVYIKKFKGHPLPENAER